MCSFLELGFPVQEPALGKFGFSRQREYKMSLILTVSKGIEPAVIAIIAEGKLRICPGKGMLHPKAHAIAATVQIAIQLHAKLSREVGVVLS